MKFSLLLTALQILRQQVGYIIIIISFISGTWPMYGMDT